MLAVNKIYEYGSDLHLNIFSNFVEVQNNASQKFKLATDANP